MLIRGVSQAQQNQKPAFGGSYREVAKIFSKVKTYNKETKNLMKKQLSEIVQREINAGKYSQAHRTLENAIKVSESFSETTQKRKGRDICSITSKIAEEQLYPAIAKLKKQYQISKTSVHNSGKNLLKRMGYISTN